MLNITFCYHDQHLLSGALTEFDFENTIFKNILVASVTNKKIVNSNAYLVLHIIFSSHKNV